MAYDTTTVAVSKSQADLRKLLTMYGAQRFSFHEGRGVHGDDRVYVALEFVHAEDFERPHLIRLMVPVKPIDEGALARRIQRARRSDDELRHDAEEQELRRIWRVIFYAVKSRMEAVAEELETFEQAFLPHIVDPVSGMTVWESVRGPIEAGELAIGGPGMKALGAGR